MRHFQNIGRNFAAGIIYYCRTIMPIRVFIETFQIYIFVSDQKENPAAIIA